MSVLQAPPSVGPGARPRLALAAGGALGVASDPARAVLVERACRGLLCLSVLAYVLFFLRLSFSLLDNLGIRTFDLAIFDQATWLIAHGHAPFVTVRGLHILAEHFSAVLYLLAPLYLVWDSPKMLLTVQTLALAAGAVPVYALARKRLASPLLALLFGLAYLLYPPLQWTNTFEFHPDTLVTPCLLGAFFFLTERRWCPFFCLLALAALCKETVGLEILALGIYALVLYRRERAWRMGAWAVALGLLALAVSLGAVSHFNGERPSLFYLLYSRYGDSPRAIAAFAAAHPLRLLADLCAPDNRLYAFQLLYPVLFLSLLAPEVLLLALPALGLHLLSGHAIMHTIFFQYTALVTPFVFAAAILGAERLRRWGDRRTGALLAAALCLGLWQGAAQRPASSAWPTLPPTMPAAQADETWDLLRVIPPGASVSCPVALMPRLAHRREAYLFPNPFLPAAWGSGELALRQMGAEGYAAADAAVIGRAARSAPAEYVALCPATTAFPLSPRDPLYLDFAAPVVRSAAYGIVAVGRDTLLLRRGADPVQGRRLLSARTGLPVTSEPEVDRAFLAWTAAQPTKL